MLVFFVLSAYIKMGDYYWYGCQRERNPAKAAELYSLAAQRGEPHVSGIILRVMLHSNFDNYYYAPWL